MRCIRLRAGNIQIGNEYALQDLFTEPRGTKYFIGEVHAVDKNLIPNGRRDYFEENEACNVLETVLREYFCNLQGIYHYALEIKKAFNETKRPQIFSAEIERHTPEYQETHRAEHDAKLNKLRKEADKADKFITQKRRAAEYNPESITSRVFKQIVGQKINTPTDSPVNPCTSRLPKRDWSAEQKKLYNEIYEIILANPKSAGNALIKKFEKILK